MHHGVTAPPRCDAGLADRHNDYRACDERPIDAARSAGKCALLWELADG